MSELTVFRPPAAQGIAWVREGWSLFKLAAVPWAGMTALVFLVLIGVGSLPYVGAVVVNDGNGRYFEPGPGRTFLLGIDLRWIRYGVGQVLHLKADEYVAVRDRFT